MNDKIKTILKHHGARIAIFLKYDTNNQTTWIMSKQTQYSYISMYINAKYTYNYVQILIL